MYIQEILNQNIAFFKSYLASIKKEQKSPTRKQKGEPSHENCLEKEKLLMMRVNISYLYQSLVDISVYHNQKP